MPINSRNKGAAGERELASYLKERGVEARRGQQHAGGGDSPDIVVAWVDVHVECKRTEHFSIYDAVDQARRDSAGTGRVPIVAHRCNGNRSPRASCRGEWLVVMSLDDFLMYKSRVDALTAIVGEMI